jgi:hypothetical protein
VCQIRHRIEPVFFSGFDDTVDHRACRRALWRVGEEPVLAPDREWLDAPFAAIVVQLQTTVEQKRGQGLPLIVAIADRLAGRLNPGDLAQLKPGRSAILVLDQNPLDLV